MTALRRLLVAVCLVGGLWAPADVAAQETRADTAAVLLDVATQLEREGRTELSGALYRLILERYPGTVAATEVQRRQRLAAVPGNRMDRGGRVELIVGGTLYGLALGGTVPYLIAGEDVTPEGVGLGFLVGGPAGFLLAKNYAEKSLRGEGHARAITFGGLWGGWQGFGWREVLDVGTTTTVNEVPVCVEFDQTGCVRFREESYESEDVSARAVIAAAVLGSVTGIVIGDLLGRNHRITPGMASTANLGAFWGTAYGWTSAYLLDQDDDGAGDDKILAWALVGGNVGLVASAWFAQKHDLTREQARLISIAGVAGAAVGAGVDLLVVRDEKLAIAIPMVTSAAGMVLGYQWVKDRRSEDGGRDGRGALLHIEDGRVELGTPTPLPTMLRAAGGTGEPGLRVELLSTRF